MKKLCIFLGITIVGWIGWWLGSWVGDVTAYMLSGVGSMVGVYVGWRINRDYFECSGSN